MLHDISDGGLAVSIAEICIKSSVGARIDFPDWRNLFSEDPHRLVAVAAAELAESVAAEAADVGVALQRIGSVGGSTIAFCATDGAIDSVSLEDATIAWRGAIRDRMET